MMKKVYITPHVLDVNLLGLDPLMGLMDGSNGPKNPQSQAPQKIKINKNYI